MKCQGLWYGGVNYAAPDPDRDLESFDSLKDAKRTLEAREDFEPGYPCVSDSELHVYFGGYSENGPDRVLRMGPRGGVRVERA